MQKIEDEYTGNISFHFGKEEFKKVKWAAAACCAVFALAVCASAYSVYSTQTLSAENRLYKNQLKMAEEKMGKLEEKAESIEKISGEVQSIVNGQRGSSSGAELAGQGGGSTVPDIAQKVKPEEIKTPGDLLGELARLDEVMDEETKVMVDLRAKLLSGSYTVKAMYGGTHPTPSGWPVIGEISSEYGWRVSPAGIGSSYHEGVDIATNYNVPVQVTADGTVSRAGWEDGYGYLVEVRHDGGVVTRYGHNSAIVVYEGQELHRGDTVALAGSTGNSTGPHCHYEVRINGASVDPKLFLNQ